MTPQQRTKQARDAKRKTQDARHLLVQEIACFGGAHSKLSLARTAAEQEALAAETQDAWDDVMRALRAYTSALKAEQKEQADGK